MDPVTFDIKLTKSDYTRLYLWAGYVRGYRAVVTVLATLLSTALLALLILSLALGLTLDVLLTVFFALPAAIMLFFLFSILFTAVQAYNNSGMADGGRCEIKPHEVIFENPHSLIVITPDMVRKVYFKRKYIYIALPEMKYHIIPISCIPEEKYDTAMGHLEALG